MWNFKLQNIPQIYIYINLINILFLFYIDIF